MRRSVLSLLIVIVWCSGIWLRLPGAPPACISAYAASSAPPAASSNDPDVMKADHEFLDAAAKADKAALGKLLDTNFTWTSSDGKTWTREQVLQGFPKPVTVDGSGVEVKQYTYGQVGIVETNRGFAHALHVWVKRPAGWRALAYQEVTSLKTPPAATPDAGTDCENPCKAVPFQPKNEIEKEVITAYRGIETTAMAEDAEKWPQYVADEFVAISSNSDKVFDKATRVAGFRQSKEGGLAPTPLVSARMFDFASAVVMVSLHRPDRGRPIHVTRVWIERDGRWVESASYQTSIRAEPAKP